MHSLIVTRHHAAAKHVYEVYHALGMTVVYVRFVTNRSGYPRTALPLVPGASAEDAAARGECGVGPVHCPAQSGMLAASRKQGLSKPATKHRNRDVHQSVVTTSRAHCRNARASPRHPRRVTQAACRNGPGVPNRARSAESWRSGRRRSRKSAGTPRFLRAPPPT